MERRLERKAGSVELLLLEMHKKTKDKKLLQVGTPSTLKYPHVKILQMLFGDWTLMRRLTTYLSI